MPFLTPEDLKTHLYAEVVEEISRGDAAIVTEAIEAAVQEVKLYLRAYDTEALFGTETEPPIVADAMLRHHVKSVACWRLVLLCQIATDTDRLRQAYAEAISTLAGIEAGTLRPKDWPEATKESDDEPIFWSSHEKRENGY